MTEIVFLILLKQKIWKPWDHLFALLEALGKESTEIIIIKQMQEECMSLWTRMWHTS